MDVRPNPKQVEYIHKKSFKFQLMTLNKHA